MMHLSILHYSMIRVALMYVFDMYVCMVICIHLWCIYEWYIYLWCIYQWLLRRKYIWSMYQRYICIMRTYIMDMCIQDICIMGTFTLSMCIMDTGINCIINCCNMDLYILDRGHLCMGHIASVWYMQALGWRTRIIYPSPRIALSIGLLVRPWQNFSRIRDTCIIPTCMHQDQWPGS